MERTDSTLVVVTWGKLKEATRAMYHASVAIELPLPMTAELLRMKAEMLEQDAQDAHDWASEYGYISEGDYEPQRDESRD